MVRFEKVDVVFNHRVVALCELDLKIEKGEFVFLVGATGAGKSTLLKLITREAQPKRGQIWSTAKR